MRKLSMGMSAAWIGVLMTALSVGAQEPRTPAERTDFQAGPTMYADLMEFIYELDARSDLMQVQKIAQTLGGRDVVLAVLSDPPVFQPADLAGSDKPIVLIVNNVHGGEVAGKDASLILMRDLLFGDLRPLLDEVVVLNVPTINPDGAEERRRTNEQNFDMNRDYLKLESQEIHGLVTKVIHRWRPDIHVDTHHGGSAPYTLTYQSIMNPAGDPEIMRVANERIIPRIRAALRAEDYDGFWYSGPRTVDGVAGWAPTSVEPRKQHVYSGLANIVDFLFETPSGTHRVVDDGARVVPVAEEDRYRHQVRGQYIGQRELITFAADEPVLLRQTVREAAQRATRLGADDSDDDAIVLEYRQVPRMEAEFWRAEGWQDRQRGEEDPRPEGGADVEYELVRAPVFTRFEPTRTTTRPWGYVLPPQLATVVPLLLDHGISVQKLAEPFSLEVEVYYATAMDNSEYFQGHYLNKVTAVKRAETVDFAAGSFFVPAGQPKSNLVCYILEPETDDNLVTWGFLDTYLRATTGGEAAASQERMARYRGRSESGEEPPPGQLIPLYRVMKRTELKGALAQSFNTYEPNRYVR